MNCAETIQPGQPAHEMFGKGWEDMATKGIENWPLSTTHCQLTRENCSKSPHKPYVART